MIRLTNTDNLEESLSSIVRLLESRPEWLCSEGRAAVAFNISRADWDLREERGALFLTLWGARGARVWRIVGWDSKGGSLSLEVTRRAGAERVLIEFVPRASVEEGMAVVRAARMERCSRVAELAREALTSARVEQVRLSAGARRNEPGRYARVQLRAARVRVCVTAPVVALGPEETDAFLTSALLWFERDGAKKDDGARRLWLFAQKELAAATAERVALLREGLRGSIEIFEMDEDLSVLDPCRVPALDDLLSRAPRLVRPADEELSETARMIVALAPDAIDVVHARRGETLRFRGLAFARVRKVMVREAAWFGVESAGMRRRALDEESWPELVRLVGELSEHRREGAADKRHAYFRASPEAWLESLLRRDVTRLDPGLRLAPLHAQLRTSRASGTGSRPVDLLALRRDGRLVVIELKVSEDAALPLQGADYWRRVEAHRRRGNITAARLFGDAYIEDSPPLVYLVAPMLRFHRSFHTLARCVSTGIEMYRFDLNEDWRAGVRVARRARID